MLFVYFVFCFLCLCVRCACGGGGGRSHACIHVSLSGGQLLAFWYLFYLLLFTLRQDLILNLNWLASGLSDSPVSPISPTAVLGSRHALLCGHWGSDSPAVHALCHLPSPTHSFKDSAASDLVVLLVLLYLPRASWGIPKFSVLRLGFYGNLLTQSEAVVIWVCVFALMPGANQFCHLVPWFMASVNYYLFLR